MRRALGLLGRLLAVAAVLLVGARSVLRARAVGEAERTAAGLASRYGEGCVAVLRSDDAASTLRCRAGGVEVGYAIATKDEGRRVIGVNGMCLDPAHDRSSFVIDVYAPDGRPLGTTGTVVFFDRPATLGASRQSGWPTPRGASPPLVVALRSQG